MTLVYLSLPLNPDAYVWDMEREILFSAYHGARVGSPDGLYQLKLGRTFTGDDGYKVTIRPYGERQIISVWDIKRIVNNNPIRLYTKSSYHYQKQTKPEVVQRYIVVNEHVELLTREEAIAREIEMQKKTGKFGNFRLIAIKEEEEIEVQVVSRITVDGKFV